MGKYKVIKLKISQDKFVLFTNIQKNIEIC